MPATIYAQAAGSIITASGNSGALTMGIYTELEVDIDITAATGTTPSMTMILERQEVDTNYYPVWTSAALTAAGLTSMSIGPGLTTNAEVSGTFRLRWTVTGTTPSFTLSINVMGGP